MIDGLAQPVTQPASTSQTRARVIAIVAAVAAAILIRVVLLPGAGLPGDLDAFAQWVGHISREGLPNAYKEEISFGPVMTYVWWLLGLIEPGFRAATDSSDPSLRILLKLPAVLADFGLAACVAWILRSTPGWAVVGAVVVLLHPATWYVSAWWGQYESIYVLAALVAVLFAVSGRDGLAAVALAVAVLTKPQALPFLVPFAAWFLARGGPLGLLRAVAIGAAVAFVLWLPFLASGGLMDYLGNLGQYQNDVYSVLSLKAWNFWWIIQDLAPVDESCPTGCRSSVRSRSGSSASGSSPCSRCSSGGGSGATRSHAPSSWASPRAPSWRSRSSRRCTSAMPTERCSS